MARITKYHHTAEDFDTPTLGGTVLDRVVQPHVFSNEYGEIQIMLEPFTQKDGREYWKLHLTNKQAMRLVKDLLLSIKAV